MERKTKYLLAFIILLSLSTALVGLSPPTSGPVPGATGLLINIARLQGQGITRHLVTLVSAAFVAFMMWVTYFLPSALAFQSRHPRCVLIFLVNLLLGWVGIGWFVAFFWVMRGDGAASNEIEDDAQEAAILLARRKCPEFDDAPSDEVDDA
jgi:hypothetical protein